MMMGAEKIVKKHVKKGTDERNNKGTNLEKKGNKLAEKKF